MGGDWAMTVDIEPTASRMVGAPGPQPMSATFPSARWRRSARPAADRSCRHGRYLPAPGGDWQAGRHAGELRGDRGAPAGSGPDLEPTAERREPVGHVPLARAHRGVAGVVAGAVVGHSEPQGPVLR